MEESRYQRREASQEQGGRQQGVQLEDYTSEKRAMRYLEEEHEQFTTLQHELEDAYVDFLDTSISEVGSPIRFLKEGIKRHITRSSI